MTTPSTTPVSGNERIDTLDILRGFALLGILVVNILIFSSPHNVAQPAWGTPVDSVAQGLVLFTAHGKFYPIFSFLFGLGFSLQMASAERKGNAFVPLFQRRLFLLGIIGILHALLLSQLDILVQYAVLGYLLLLLRNGSTRLLLGMALGSLVFAFVLRMLMTLANVQEYLWIGSEQRASVLIDIYANGSIAEIFRQRLDHIAEQYVTMVSRTSYKVFAMFLVGAWVGRLKVFQNIPTHRTMLRNVMWVGLSIGLVSNVLYALTTLLDTHFSTPILEIIFMGLFAVGDIAFSAFYITGIALLVENIQWKQRLVPLTYVGRMALTNYIMQSLICTTIFYSYGLGLYGKVGAAMTILVACTIYLFQVVVSGLWLQWFRYGPLEWVWRSLTYGRWLPLRVTPRVRDDTLTIS